MIPKSILAQAIPIKARVGREYDSTGKHVAYWYSPPSDPTWRIYRHSVNGMLALLRQVKRNHQ